MVTASVEFNSLSVKRQMEQVVKKRLAPRITNATRNYCKRTLTKWVFSEIIEGSPFHQFVISPTGHGWLGYEGSPERFWARFHRKGFPDIFDKKLLRTRKFTTVKLKTNDGAKATLKIDKGFEQQLRRLTYVTKKRPAGLPLKWYKLIVYPEAFPFFTRVAFVRKDLAGRSLRGRMRKKYSRKGKSNLGVARKGETVFYPIRIGVIHSVGGAPGIRPIGQMIIGNFDKVVKPKGFKSGLVREIYKQLKKPSFGEEMASAKEIKEILREHGEL